MVADQVPNLFYAFAVPVGLMAASAVIAGVLYRVLTRFFRLRV